jgi:hypothetical protein
VYMLKKNTPFFGPVSPYLRMIVSKELHVCNINNCRLIVRRFTNGLQPS